MTALATRLSGSREWAAAEALARQFFLRKARRRHIASSSTFAPAAADHAKAFRAAIRRFDELLDSGVPEAAMHSFLREHPVFLGPAGTLHSKPSFPYPAPHPRTGKLSLQPDFIVSWPDGSYDVIEIECPGAELIRRDASPRRELVQPSFQIGEFRAFVMDHAERISIPFPGIRGNASFKLIIGRDDSLGADETEISAQKAMLRAMHNIDRILTYDDLRRSAVQLMENLDRFGKT